MPEDFGYEGQWLAPTVAFVYRPVGQRTKDAMSPRITPRVQLPGSTSFGFDVGQLAAAFDLTEEDVFKANEQHLLVLLDFQPVVLGTGRRGAVFRFGIGTVNREFTVEDADHSGTA